MRAGKAVFVPIVSVDIESAEAIHALEFLEAIQWDLASTSHKLKKLGPFFLVE